MKRSTAQKALEALSALVLLAAIAVTILLWGELPSQLPGHFNAAGQIDSWVGKGSVWFLLGINAALWLLLTVVSQFPNAWNMPVQVTPQNREAVFHTALTMLLTLKLCIMLMFAYILFHVLAVKLLGQWFLPVSLIAIFGTLGGFIIKIRK